MASQRRCKIADLASSSAGSIAIGPFGSALKAELYTESGVPVLRGQDIGVGKHPQRSGTFVAPETARRLARSLVREGDLVFPHRGAIGEVGLIGDDEFLLSSSMMKLTVDRSKAEPAFLMYYFRGPGRRELMMRASTVGTPGIAQPLASLREIDLALPSLGEQRAIAEVLGALDDKIAANTKLAATADALAMSLFVRSLGSETREYEISEVADLVTRGITPSYVDGGSDATMVLGQRCVRGQRVDLGPARWTDPARVKSEKLLSPGDVLINSTGMGSLGRVGRWTYAREATVDSHVTLVRFNDAVVNTTFAGFALLRLEREIEVLAEGSTGQTELPRGSLARMKICVPSNENALPLAETLDALVAMAEQVRNEKQALAATRDALLPQLMSGKLTVHAAEAIAEELA
ncbi:Restriction endonuclease S subunit [Beutenbergia cavernae DSM 12333]|uniref:Restriction endonuclease S subunit n=1 Tax=Beutenbergia cavernae (strain ATCC BAA-8 / DSM 12333 / CCUG 43141 / JCM 11478 / NBRC 16432 / NCIMB 13614 / HKI 0122) TaxID=471853 RepID=C5C4N1_BEUC1|nr:restriction endonuclease subunit S [Beutenbergia cavernae]ACQ82155.1 Restriction endonuclease S subunit [Beutenbergia cavernae DSM 12333]